MKWFIWKGKGKYSSQKYDLLPDKKYEIGKDIKEEDAERINKDFGNLVDIVSDTDKKEDKKEDKVKGKII
jgi:hypothetical protein